MQTYQSRFKVGLLLNQHGQDNNKCYAVPICLLYHVKDLCK